MRKKKNKRKINMKKLIIILAIIIFVLMVSGITTVMIIKNNDNNEEINNNVQKIDEMENYDYYLDENATDYYKELYNELKAVLNNEEINQEEYAKIVSKLFVADLFTLDNKLTSSDIGGLQFVYTDFKDDFINIAKTTLYSSVESNIYGDRTQELPIVSNIEINNIEKSSFNYDSTDYESFVINVSIEYQKDLGYPTSYKLTLIKNDKYLQVAAAE